MDVVAWFLYVVILFVDNKIRQSDFDQAFHSYFQGPMMRGWYFFLDKTYAGSKSAALKMVLTDQV